MSEHKRKLDMNQSLEKQDTEQGDELQNKRIKIKSVCCVRDCGNTSDEILLRGDPSMEITFHEFPSDVRLRDAWYKALALHSTVPEQRLVCSAHFISEDISFSENGSKQILAEAIPGIINVCLICLSTDTKLILMARNNLHTMYERVMGIPLFDTGNLKQTLCEDCLNKLISSNSLKNQFMQSRAMLNNLGLL